MNAAIILSGGVGSRLGADIPKQYIEVEGKSILEHSLHNFVNDDKIDIIVIVVANEWISYVKTFLSERISFDKEILFTLPGETRQLSILNGLKAIKSNMYPVDKVIIHDAARPLVSKDLINRCLDGVIDGFDGVMPVLPVKDTIYTSLDGQRISSLLDRRTLFAGQAPEAFKFEKYLKSHSEISSEELLKINGSSELAYKTGMKIKMIPGDPNNYKITDYSDLERFKTTLS